MRSLLLLLLLVPATAAAEDSFLIRFGVGETTGQDWSGRLNVRAGRVTGLDGWQFDGEDAVGADGHSWKTATTVEQFWHSPWERRLFGTKRLTRLSERGIILTLKMDGPGEVSVETPQGRFAFAPAGIDWSAPRRFLDGAVEVARTPAPNRMSSIGAEDYVTSMLASDGAEWVAWQTYRNLGDRLWVRRGTAEPEAITNAGADLFRVRLAEGHDGAVWAVWSEQRDGNFDLYARRWKDGNWSGVERITSASGPDIFHDLAADRDGRLYLVWQSMRSDNSDIYLKIREGGQWGEARRVSDSAANDWQPAAAVSRTGRVAVVWDTYSAGNYDVFLRVFENGELAKPIPVAATPSFEARAQALYDRDGRLWLAWEEGDPQWGKDYVKVNRDAGMGLLMRRQVRLAVYEDGRLREPAGDLAAALPEKYRMVFIEPRLAIDGAGVPWVLFRYRTNTPVRRGTVFRSMWREGAAGFKNGGWTPVIRLAQGYGRGDAGHAVHTDAAGNLRLFWVADGREYPIGYPGEQDLFSATLAISGPAEDTLALRDFRFPQQVFPPVHPSESADVQRLRDYRVKIGGKSFRIVRGDMHRHTDLSWDGNRDGSLFDAYRYAWDAAAHDFIGVADHNAGNNVEYHWWMIQKAGDLFEIPGAFEPLYGYERSRSYPSGHRNVMFDHRGVPVLKQTQAELTDNAHTGVEHLYKHVRQERGVIMSHTSATGAGTDWRDSDPEVETLMEVYQGYRNSYEHEGAPRTPRSGFKPAGFVWKAWEKGIKLGLESSSDHVSTHASHSMIFVEELTRTGILDGIRARRAYAATDNILVDFRVNGALMGSEITTQGRPTLKVKVVGTAPVKKIEVIRNNKYVHTQPGGAAAVDFTFVDNSPLPGESFYYIRVEQEDGELAWASPVWVTRATE